MKNKIIHIIVFILVIALLVCASISIYKIVHNKAKDENVINIDCDDEECNKPSDDKQDTDDNKNKDTENKSTDNKENNGTSGSESESNSGSGNGSGSGSGSDSGSGEGESGSGDSGSSDVPAENVTVSDKEQEWSRNTILNIFNVENVAPGESGTYDFMINNNTSKNVNYSITFDEHNQYGANIMYKLKRNNKYIAGDTDNWVYYNELNLSDKILNSSDKDSYILEWKWVSTDNDTSIGRIRGAKYSIDIFVKALETSGIDPDGGSGSGSFNPFTGDNILYYVELLIISALAILLLVLKRKNSEENESA